MRIIVFIVATGLLTQLAGNNVAISNVQWNDVNNVISFDLGWENSWSDGSGDFRDAVWVFVKYRAAGGQWRHTRIQVSGSPPTNMAIDEPNDLKGAFIHRSIVWNGTNFPDTYNFDVLASVSDLGPFPDFKVFGIEMVYIPEGPFYIGGPSSHPTFEYLHLAGDPSQGLEVTSEALIEYSASFDPKKYGVTNATGTNFQHGLPATFPKGYSSFYCMKYEITQKQYVDFLNTLNETQQNNRTFVDITIPGFNLFVLSGSTSVINRSGVYYMGKDNDGHHTFGCNYNGNTVANEIDDGLNIACGYLQNLDVLAYLDWAALRPMSRTEVYKICRGPLLPVQDEHAWGNSNFNQIIPGNLSNIGRPNEIQSTPVISPSSQLPVRSGFAATATSNRVMAGATYYGVMEMSGSVGELVLGIKFIGQIDFLGTNGDGNLDGNGDYTNADWSAGSSILFGSEQWNLNTLISFTSHDPTVGGRGVR